MKTIRQRIDAMHRADRLYHKLDYEYPIDDATDEETAALVSATQAADQLDDAIIADWNAMLTVINLLLLDYDENPPSEADNHPGWWGCRYCDGEQWDHPERHNPDKCPVAAAQAALARMAGLHETETVV